MYLEVCRINAASSLTSAMTQVAVNGIALAVISTQTLSPGDLTAFLVTSLGIQRSLGLILHARYHLTRT